VGVASTGRLDELAAQLRPLVADENVLDAADRSTRFTPWSPEIQTRMRTVRTPEDHLSGARSVLVFGLRFHAEVLRWATRPPAEAVGPYAYQTYVTNWLGAVIGFRLVKRLEELGYAGVLTMDLTGTESVTANPRGPQPDLFSNRFAAIAAGLGHLTVSGHLATPQFGIRQRLFALVTTADLTPSLLAPGPARRGLCDTCDRRCVAACPTRALQDEEVRVTCAGAEFRFARLDLKRCDWSKRYGLVASEGFGFLGSKVESLPGPGPVTASQLDASLRLIDPIKKYRPVVAEPCVLVCPYASDDRTR
jgi:hypothetical protein